MAELDDLRTRRRRAVPLVLYLDATGVEGAEWLDWVTDAPVLLVSPELSAIIASTAKALVTQQQAEPLDDHAARAVLYFAWLGENYQALAEPIVSGLQAERDRWYDADHPESDPYYGLNDQLTGRPKVAKS